ncbi:MAG: flagellar hook-length control protein FliK, partial [Lysobacter sp.]
IRLQIDGNRISAEFQSANADVRHALENSVGRLRDMLGQQGMQLAHSDVGQGRGEREARGGGDVHRDDAAGPGLDRSDTANTRPVRVRGLLDEYA